MLLRTEEDVGAFAEREREFRLQERLFLEAVLDALLLLSDTESSSPVVELTVKLDDAEVVWNSLNPRAFFDASRLGLPVFLRLSSILT